MEMAPRGRETDEGLYPVSATGADESQVGEVERMHGAHTLWRPASPRKGVPAVLSPKGVSVSHPKARLGGHALMKYPHCGGRTHSSRHERTFGPASDRSNRDILVQWKPVRQPVGICRHRSTP